MDDLETPQALSCSDDEYSDEEDSDEEDYDEEDSDEVHIVYSHEVHILYVDDVDMLSSDEESRFTRCAEFPYLVGNSISLQLKTPQHETTVEAKIMALFEPFTFSCTMIVPVNCPALAMDGNQDMVLKIFDRCFSWSSREINNLKPWSAEIEKDFIRFASDETGSKFVEAVPKFNEEPPRKQSHLWNTSQREGFMEYFTMGISRSENKAYELMKDMQGTDIPRLLAKVLLPAGDLALPEPHEQGFSGILLELWQPICNDAARIMDRMVDHGVLNMDIHGRGFFVSLDVEEAPGFKVTLADFGVCEFRDEHDNEQKWNETKEALKEDQLQEDGYIGHEMQFKLRGAIEWPRPPGYPKIRIDYAKLGPIPGLR
ncbi:hypothetical protein N7540_002204 [Penicillium herquei]|nr:hypothetical protein N7540_002204 [Penicillium herquei]